MHKVQIYFFVALFIAVLLFTGALFLPFLAPVSLALMSAVILRPVYKSFVDITKGRAGFASSLTIIFAAIVIVCPLFILGTQILKESYDLYSSIQDHGLGGMDKTITSLLEPVKKIYPALNVNVEEYVRSVAGWILANLGNLFTFTASTIFGFFLWILTLYYLLKDGKKLRTLIKKLSPLADKYDEQIISTLESAVNSIVRGSLIMAIVQGVFIGIGFYVFGIDNAILWGTIASISTLVPSIGTALVVIPAVFYLFVTGSIGAAIGLAIWGTFAVGTIDNLLLPYLFRRGLKSHPLPLLLSILGGISMFGPIGIFLGPLVIALLIALMDIYTIIGKNEA